jgi:hypothetical protein
LYQLLTNCKRKNENYSKIRASGLIPVLAPEPELIGPAGPLLDRLEALHRRHSVPEQNPAAQTISDRVDQAGAWLIQPELQAKQVGGNHLREKFRQQLDRHLEPVPNSQEEEEEEETAAKICLIYLRVPNFLMSSWKYKIDKLAGQVMCLVAYDDLLTCLALPSCLRTGEDRWLP